MFTPNDSGAVADDVTAKNLSFKITDTSGISTISNVTVVVGPEDKIDTSKIDSLSASANNATTYAPSSGPAEISFGQLFLLDGVGPIKPSSIVLIGDTATSKAITSADGTWTVINGAIRFVPSKGFSGTSSMQVAAVDEYGNTVFDTVTVVVGAKGVVSRSLVDQVNVTRPGVPAWLNPLSGARTTLKTKFDPSTVQLWNGVAWVKSVTTRHGIWQVIRGQVRFTPATGFLGITDIPVRASTGSGLFSFADLKVSVRDGFMLLPATGMKISYLFALSGFMLLVGAVLLLRRRRLL